MPGVIAAALGLAVPFESAMPAVVAHLRHRSMLLVLDNCEHVIEVAAFAAEQISSRAPGVHLLSTSREPLRAAGERVHRLPPLESLSATAGLTATEVMTFLGIQLFVERVAESLNGFVLTDAEAYLVADICRRLDGIALAIVLAAGRVAAFGVHELAARLDDRFRLLTIGRRTALPRHQTLAATLDWSFELLTGSQQTLLQRLAIFAGDFSLDGAGVLMQDAEAADVVGEVAKLVAKSLVVADLRPDGMRSRLLDSTRIHGLGKLRASGGFHQAGRAHAEYVRSQFEHAEADCETLTSAEWLSAYAGQIDNLRVALDWAGSIEGDTMLLVALTVTAVPLWVQLSLMGGVPRAGRACAGGS